MSSRPPRSALDPSPPSPSGAPGNLLTEWARTLVDALAGAGIADAVISPGSRSTPFVAALTARRDLRCWDVIDERSAAFFALGQARVTGHPTLLLCTSGTAGANYLPAVVEARRSATPLVVLTADRPFELMECAAPQTIDQTHLFGHHVRGFFELGEPDPSTVALRSLRRKAVQAVWRSLAPEPGPVHLNARARKPLEPVAAVTGAERDLERRARELAAQPAPRWVLPTGAVSPPELEDLATACRGAERGLIVCGPAAVAQAGAREAVGALAAATGFPLLVEAASQLRFAPALGAAQDLRCGAFDAFLRTRRFLEGPGVEARGPELVIQLGPPPTSGAWSRYLARHPEAELAVLAPHGWNDPTSSARWLVFAEVAAGAEALVRALHEAGSRRESADRDRWRQAFTAAESATWAAAAEVVESGGAELSEGAVARQLVAALPDGALLALGNSLPIRQVDLWAAPADRALKICSQRGANGIDGVVSGAAGAASTLAEGTPAALLIGDVSFLHDLGGLAVARRVPGPLVLVVVHNDGGRIFEQLPLPGAVAPELLDHWTTPHGLSFEPAARLYGVGYRRCVTTAELDVALAKALAQPGCTVIEAVVPPHGALEQTRALVAQLDAALGRGEIP